MIVNQEDIIAYGEAIPSDEPGIKTTRPVIARDVEGKVWRFSLVIHDDESFTTVDPTPYYSSGVPEGFSLYPQKLSTNEKLAILVAKMPVNMPRNDQEDDHVLADELLIEALHLISVGTSFADECEALIVKYKALSKWYS